MGRRNWQVSHNKQALRLVSFSVTGEDVLCTVDGQVQVLDSPERPALQVGRERKIERKKEKKKGD